MLKPEQNSETITPDGGIIKIPIKEQKGGKLIKWVKGINAKFHYKVYAYVFPIFDGSTNENTCQGHAHNEQSHSCCSNKKTKDEQLQEKVDLIKSLLEPKKSKESAAILAEPKGKPVRTLVGDSRKNDEKPFELRIGYSFSVEAMEICIKTMKVGETARFLCMPDYCEVGIILNLGFCSVGICNAPRKDEQEVNF
jgi:hypothetical protein